METFPTIDGILMLDDIIGFIGEDRISPIWIAVF